MDSIEVSQDNVTTTQQTIQIITIFPLNMGNYSLSVLFGSFFPFHLHAFVSMKPDEN